jgi:hypothetical protein
MPLSTRITVVALATAAALSLNACSATETTATTPTPALVVYGSGSAAPSMQGGDSNAVFGPASSLTIKVYALYISTNADCSSPQLVQDLGAGENKDFMANPALFEGTPTNGTYQCVMMKMSDVLTMTPGATFGACTAGTSYSGDIYRDGQTDFVDVNLNPVVGHGTDSLPVDDQVTIFMTRDPAAAQARGISSHQAIPLVSSLVVPGQTTFHMDASHAVATDGVQCGIEPPVMSFSSH